MSPQTVLRIWDCLFNEGSKILFRVALTLIKQHQRFILEATSVADICDRFKQITKGTFVTECHTFMQASFAEARPSGAPQALPACSLPVCQTWASAGPLSPGGLHHLPAVASSPLLWPARVPAQLPLPILV